MWVDAPESLSLKATYNFFFFFLGGALCSPNWTIYAKNNDDDNDLLHSSEFDKTFSQYLVFSQFFCLSLIFSYMKDSSIPKNIIKHC